MNSKCKIIIEYASDKQAEKILDSINVDNYDFVQAEKKGKTLIASIQTEKITSLLHTIDDYLSCISVAEKIVK